MYYEYKKRYLKKKTCIFCHNDNRESQVRRCFQLKKKRWKIIWLSQSVPNSITY